MTEEDFRDALIDAISMTEEDNALNDELLSVKTFSSAGVLTDNEGMIIKLLDGSEFQVTIVKTN